MDLLRYIMMSWLVNQCSFAHFVYVQDYTFFIYFLKSSLSYTGKIKQKNKIKNKTQLYDLQKDVCQINIIY